MDKISVFIDKMLKKGWKINIRDNSEIILSKGISDRYSQISDEFLHFLKIVGTCVSEDEKFWFLTLDDYKGLSESAFHWDEIEKMSLSEQDDEYNREIIEFWNFHLPIVLSVRNGYEYYAIDLRNDVGSIVYGYSPEFEEPEKIANTFIQFLEMIVENKI